MTTTPKLTPAQQKQLRALASGRGLVNLGTIRGLMSRGLVKDTSGTRDSLKIHCRLSGAYPLTEAGQAVLAALGDEP